MTLKRRLPDQGLAVPAACMGIMAQMANRRHMAQVGAAAAAQHPQPGQLRLQAVVILRQFVWIAIIQRQSLVQFSMAEPRGVG